MADTPLVSRALVERVRVWAKDLLPVNRARGLSPADLEALVALADAVLDAKEDGTLVVASMHCSACEPVINRIRALLETEEGE